MKTILHISGRLLSPLKEGSTAIIAYGGDVIRTSRVVEIHEYSETEATFETMNAIYRVSLIPLTVPASFPMARGCAA